MFFSFFVCEEQETAKNDRQSCIHKDRFPKLYPKRQTIIIQARRWCRTLENKNMLISRLGLISHAFYTCKHPPVHTISLYGDGWGRGLKAPTSLTSIYNHIFIQARREKVNNNYKKRKKADRYTHIAYYYSIRISDAAFPVWKKKFIIIPTLKEQHDCWI